MLVLHFLYLRSSECSLLLRMFVQLKIIQLLRSSENPSSSKVAEHATWNRVKDGGKSLIDSDPILIQLIGILVATTAHRYDTRPTTIIGLNFRCLHYKCTSPPPPPAPPTPVSLATSSRNHQSTREHDLQLTVEREIGEKKGLYNGHFTMKTKMEIEEAKTNNKRKN